MSDQNCAKGIHKDSTQDIPVHGQVDKVVREMQF